ncbi:MAG: hypothetical protein MHM6MM_004343 [Cercozoa sp. M6MM]
MHLTSDQAGHLASLGAESESRRSCARRQLASELAFRLRLQAARDLLTEHDTVFDELTSLLPCLMVVLIAEDAESAVDCERSLFALKEKTYGISHKLIRLAENGESRANLDVSVVCAMSTVFLALIQLRRGQYFRAASKLRSAWLLASKIEQLLVRNRAEVVETKNELLVLLGGFRFFCSLVPRKFGWLLKLLARISIQEGHYGQAQLARAQRSPLARLLTFWRVANFQEDEETAQVLLEEWRPFFDLSPLMSQFVFDEVKEIDEENNEGPLLMYLHGYCLRNAGKVDAAKSCFREAFTRTAELPMMQLMCQYEMAHCDLLLGEFESAAHGLAEFLAEFNRPSFRAFAQYQLGQCLALLNRQNEAKAAMSAVQDLVRPHFSFDEAAAVMAEDYVRNTYSAARLCLLRFSLAVEARSIQRALVEEAVLESVCKEAGEFDEFDAKFAEYLRCELKLMQTDGLEASRVTPEASAALELLDLLSVATMKRHSHVPKLARLRHAEFYLQHSIPLSESIRKRLRQLIHRDEGPFGKSLARKAKLLLQRDEQRAATQNADVSLLVLDDDALRERALFY